MIKNKKVFIIIILLITGIILAIFIPYSIKKNREIKAVEDVLLNQGCKLQKIINSKEKEYEKDIFLELKYKPIEENDSAYSNQYYYDQLVAELSKKINYNYRLIDSKKEITIGVEINKGYTINGDTNYFKNEINKIQIEKTQKAKVNTTSIASSVLNGIIARNWNTEKLNLQGAEHSKIDNQDLYKYKEYELIVEGDKVFNITFTKDYQEEVLNGIKTGLFNSQIKQALGEPLYNNMDAEVIIGYKLQDCYAFFYDGTISLYSSENKNSEELLSYEAKKDLGKYFGNTNNKK